MPSLGHHRRHYSEKNPSAIDCMAPKEGAAYKKNVRKKLADRAGLAGAGFLRLCLLGRVNATGTSVGDHSPCFLTRNRLARCSREIPPASDCNPMRYSSLHNNRDGIKDGASVSPSVRRSSSDMGGRSGRNHQRGKASRSL